MLQSYEIKNREGRLRLQAVCPNIFRLTYTRAESFSSRESLMRVDTDRRIPFSVDEMEEKVMASTTSLSLSIARDTLSVTYCNAAGQRLLAEDPRRPREMVAIPLYKNRLDEHSTIRRRITVDGVRVDAQNIQREKVGTTWHTKLNLCFAPDEAVMGFGSHEEGYLDLRGRSRFLYQQNMKACVPFFWSTAGYGMLFDSYTDMTFHFDGYGSYLWCDADDEMDYYFIAGGDFDTIISGYRLLTGQAPMPPRWAFGYCQSKERYMDQQELIAVAKEYRARDIPLDLIILDWKSWTGELWGQKSFDPHRFPDPDGLTHTLHNMGVKMMISIWPHMAEGGENHKELNHNGLMLLNGSTYDAMSPEGRSMYWKQTKEGLFDHGIDAWWCDCTEPFEADWMDIPVKPEPEERQRINVTESKRYLDARYLSAYSLQHSKGIYEGQRACSDKRVLNLTRSSYAGQQRYGTFTWSGDISANWLTLRRQVAEGLSFMASGCPYWTLDIGGFFVKNWMQWYGDGHYDEGPADPAYRELFLRWFQYGTFLPMMRVHGTDFPREVWRFGDIGDPIYEALVDFIRLRYRLIPYLYSLAHQVTVADYTMMRPLAADFPKDPDARIICDQFMLGKTFMVCPVLEPGANRRMVYLPPEAGWYDFWTGARVEGGWIEAPAPMERIPLYARAGTLVPLGPVVPHTGTTVETGIEVRVYPGADAEFTLYDDDGETYAYERGFFSRRILYWDDARRSLTSRGPLCPQGIYRSQQIIPVIAGEGKTP